MLRRILGVLLCAAVASCGGAEEKSFTLATTTSVENSGLLQHLAQRFRQRTGIEIHPLVVGSGQALRLAREGRVSVILTHDPEGERAFMRTGKAELNRQFARNDFIVVGPPRNPARLASTDSAVGAFRKIFDTQSAFASRGDESGTHVRELSLWRTVGVEPQRNPKYLSLGQGMSTLLRSADQLQAYALSDRATYEQLRDSLDLVSYVERGPGLENTYTVTLVKSDGPEREYAAAFVRWLLSDEGAQAIESFQIRGRAAFSVLR